MDDEHIVALYWNRDQNAIRETQRRYGPYLSKIASNILFDRRDEEECVSDTYLKAWNSMPTHHPAALAPYLAKITRELAIDRYRRAHSQKRRASEYDLSLEELGELISGSVTPESELDGKLLTEAIGSFLRTLSPNARYAFLGRYYFFDSLREVARRLGIKESRAKTMLYRIRQDLKAYLKQGGFDL